ncbi:MAG: sulfatase-like hydrolase/transferase [Christensenellales bacterium]|jgi:arylsulfatase A-like enzyme
MKTPNILLITSDQHRYDCIGYAGVYPVSTPHLDALAREGMAFSQAYTPIPTCCPARQALLSGKRPESTGGFWNYDQGLPGGVLEPEHAVWTNRLNDLGYNSAYLGKWHVHPEKTPIDFGYGAYVDDGLHKEFVLDKYGAEYLPSRPDQNGKGRGMLGAVDPLPLEDSHTHWLARRTMEMIDSFSDEKKPWHIRLDFVEPHLPCNPVKEFDQQFSAEDIPPWANLKDDFKNKPFIQKQQVATWNLEGFEWDDWKECVKRYYAFIAQTDDAIGRVLSHLRQCGLEDDTLIIYSCDHGDMGGARGMYDKHYVQYQDVIRVPMIVKWPGVVRPNSRCEEFVYPYLDLASTFLDIWGIENPGGLHGESMLELWRGNRCPYWRTQVMTTFNGAQFGLFTQRALTDRRYKYVWNATDVDELYDLQADPQELVNLAADSKQKPVLADMRKRLYQEMNSCGDSFAQKIWLKGQFLEEKKLKS